MTYPSMSPALARRGSHGDQGGFTLPELMIGLVVLAILVSLGLPSFLQTLRNAEIRAAAESIVNGLQRARAEGVTRNANVEFVLGAGTSWTVDYAVKPVPGAPALDTRSSSEGSKNVTITAVASDLVTPATKVTFNNLGQIVANAGSPAPPTLARVDFLATGGNATLRVTLGVGGNAKVCDPTAVNPAPPAAPNPRVCEF
jgi:type IV fimbrial biogenesis protein FimT